MGQTQNYSTTVYLLHLYVPLLFKKINLHCKFSLYYYKKTQWDWEYV